MRVFVTGGTGLIGRYLIGELLVQGHLITVLTRNIGKAKQKLDNKVSFCENLYEISTLDSYDAVINLAGEPIAGKLWTEKQKERLCKSRWDITSRLAQLINESCNPPYIFISGSAVGYYGAQDSTMLTENSLSHDEFIHQLCRKWESLALLAKSKQTRVCILRTGIVLSKKGGMLSQMLLPFSLGLGSVFGRGNQYISWIHIRDMVAGIIFLLNSSEAGGVFNLTAPYPETNRIFSKKLALVMSRPCVFRLPEFILKTILGEMSTMVLDGQRVFPEKLLKSGFRFQFNTLEEALTDIIKD